MPSAGVRFALLIRRRSSTRRYVSRGSGGKVTFPQVPLAFARSWRYPRSTRGTLSLPFRAFLFAILLLAVPAMAARAQEEVRTDEVVYRVVNGKELKLDVERPMPEGVARPAVVFLCGNGWGYTKAFDRTEFTYGLNLAAAKGYVGVTVDYSSTRPNSNDRPVGTFPA